MVHKPIEIEFNYDHIERFIRESNAIEGILRDPTHNEIDEFGRFMNVQEMNINEIIHFVSIYQPDAKIRDQYGMDVRVGSYIPPFGDPDMPMRLIKILQSKADAYYMHIAYEQLHPFTDGNGRSGRALWAWHHRDLSLGFLHAFYYQTLQHFSKKNLE